MTIPDTRHSLLRRLHDRTDVTAWTEFCTIYEPVIYRFAKRFSLQDADASEVSQAVLLIVSRKVEAFDIRADGRFRGWLSKLARHAAVDLIRKRRERPIGGSDIVRILSAVPAIESDPSQAFLLEARNRQFHWAAEQVRQSSHAATWQAFWLTAVEGLPAIEVARKLGMNLGAIYVARCRTLARIKNLIEPFLEEDAS